MSDRSRSAPGLDALLSHLPEHDVPEGLAARIVAQATAQPQQSRREQIVNAVPDAPAYRPGTGLGLRSLLVAAGAAALAASAGFVLLRAPAPQETPAARALATEGHGQRPQDRIGEPPGVPPRNDAGTGFAAAEEAPSVRRAPPAKPSGQIPGKPGDGIAPPPVDAEALAEAVMQAPLLANDASLGAPVEVAGPVEANRPMQGPPLPADLMPGQTGESPMTGLGIAGGVDRPASQPPGGRSAPRAGGPPRR